MILTDAKHIPEKQPLQPLGIEDVYETLRRLKGAKNVPVLFGNSGWNEC